MSSFGLILLEVAFLFSTNFATLSELTLLKLKVGSSLKSERILVTLAWSLNLDIAWRIGSDRLEQGWSGVQSHKSKLFVISLK